MNGEKTITKIQSGIELSVEPTIIEVAERKPIAVEPASPRKIFAGGKLYYKKPSAAAAGTSMLIAFPMLLCMANKTANVVKPKKVMPPAKPSMPSMKL